MFDPLSLTGMFYIASAAVGTITTAVVAKRSVILNDMNTDVPLTTFGKHVRTIKKPGFNFKWFWQSRVGEVPTKRLTHDFEDLRFQGADGQFITVNGSVRYRITDSTKFVFENASAFENFVADVTKAIRTYCATKTYLDLIKEKDGEGSAENFVIEAVADKIKEYGITLDTVALTNPRVDKEVEHSNNRRIIEENNRIANVTKAKAELEVREIEGRAAAAFSIESAKGYPELIKYMVETLPKDVPINRIIDIVETRAIMDRQLAMAQSGNLFVVQAPSTGASAHGGASMDPQMVAMMHGAMDAYFKKQKPAAPAA